MACLLRTSLAETDLLEIWAYIAQDNPSAADKLLDDVGKVCRRLAEHPEAGPNREELARNLRSFTVGNYVIFYRPITDGIIVIRVLHGARDLPELL